MFTKRVLQIAELQQKLLKHDTITHQAPKQIITIIQDKIFKNGPSKICGRQPLQKLK